MPRTTSRRSIRRPWAISATIAAAAALVLTGFTAPAQADNGSNADLILAKINTYRANQAAPLSQLYTNPFIDAATQRYAVDYYTDYASCPTSNESPCPAPYNPPGGWSSDEFGAVRVKTGSGLTTRAANALIAYVAQNANIVKWVGNYGSIGYVVHGSYAYVSLFILNYHSGFEPAVPSPVFTGHLNVGQTLSAGTGWWPAPTTTAYQWLKDNTAITGATSSTYLVAASDAGHRIDLQQTANGNGDFNFVIRSHSTAKVGKPIIDIPQIPTIAEVNGSSLPPFYGDKLEVVRGGAPWQPLPTKITYQWFRGTTAIKGATKSTYTPGAAEIGFTLKVKLTASKSGYETTTVTTIPDNSDSPTSTLVLPLPYTQNPSEIEVDGTYTVGQTLTAHPGNWAPTPTSFSYQWMRDGAPIAGATHSTHTLSSADLGHDVDVEVDAHRAHYQPAGVDSVPQTVTAP
jgi:hypothetical protein